MGGERPNIHSYYGVEAEDYGRSKWMKRNQQKTTKRAIVLLLSEKLGSDLQLIPEEQMFLEIGCGTGYSTEVLILNGFRTIGIEISPDMISQADISYYKDVHLIMADMRNLPLREAQCDHCISISAFNFASEGGSTEKDFYEGIDKSVQELHRELKSKGRAVIEFYPTEEEQKAFLSSLKHHSFEGGLLIENQDTRKEKKYLLLKKQ